MIALAAAIFALSAAAIVFAVHDENYALAWSIGAVATPAVAALVYFAYQTGAHPLLAYSNGYLELFLRPRRSAKAIRVPIGEVECFLIGQGPAQLPGRKWAGDQTTTLIVRFPERAEQWKKVEVSPSYGYWCDGHLTLRGTWCEPIDVETANRLNTKLAAAQGKTTEAPAA
jgi:hypothetical protein